MSDEQQGQPTEELRPVLIAVKQGDMTKEIREFLDSVLESEQRQAPSDCYFALIGCTCEFESVLEDCASTWCQVRQHAQDEVAVRLLRKIASDVGRSTGLETWTTWMRVLFDVDLPSELKKEWQGLKVLFRLRNLLAHGRTTKLAHLYTANGKWVGMSTAGSEYETPLNYLRDQRLLLISQPIIEPKCFLTIHTVRHFAFLVDQALFKLSRLPKLMKVLKSSVRAERIRPVDLESIKPVGDDGFDPRNFDLVRRVEDAD